MQPSGHYWETIQNITHLKVNKRNPPRQIYGEIIKKGKYATDDSDLDRVLLLQEYGGIYLDMDIMVIKSFDDLRKYECTLGFEEYAKVNGGIIICSKRSVFLTLWINTFFDDYRPNVWAYNSGEVPTKLAKRYPHLVHLENNTLHRPSYSEMQYIWGSEHYNWTQNYAIHTWIRFYNGKRPTPESIKLMNSTYGEMARLLFYGTTNIVTA